MSVNHIGLLIQVLEGIRDSIETIENGKAEQEAVEDEDNITVFEW
jgi:hypothetical protein